MRFQSSKTENNCTFVLCYDFVTRTKRLIQNWRLWVIIFDSNLWLKVYDSCCMGHTVLHISLTNWQCCSNKGIWNAKDAWFHWIPFHLISCLWLLGYRLTLRCTISRLTGWFWLVRISLIWHFLYKGWTDIVTKTRLSISLCSDSSPSLGSPTLFLVWLWSYWCRQDQLKINWTEFPS